MLRNPPPLTAAPAQSRQDIASNKLVLPSPPLECDQIDFDNVGYWTRSEWIQHQKRCEERGKDFKKLGFLTDADGRALDDDRIDAITKHARLLWNSLYKGREDPETWGVRSMFASEFFSNHMRIKFPEFRWCEGDWKVQTFATVRFPDWSQDVRKKGRLTRIFVFIFSPTC